MPEVLAPETKIIGSNPKTADDINDLFKELDTETSEKETSKKSEEKPIKEVEKPAKEDEEDDLELVEPEEDEEIEKIDLDKDTEEIATPPRKREILNKYPDLFKTFPFLEKMMYRDRQYNEMFGSFDDAKEVAERAESFGQFEAQLMDGNTKEILREVKESDEKAFNTIVDNYLPALAEVDRDAYFHVVGNLNKRLIMEMIQEANDTNNDDLKAAALLVNQFVFGTSKFTAPTTRVPKENNEGKREIEEERLNFTKERFETSRDELQTRVDNTLRATISDYIDPRGVMTPYVKKNAIADAMNILGEAIRSDPSTSKNLDNLWRASFSNKFSKESLNKIQSFYLGRAKANLKQAILKARAEALKDARSTKNEKESEEETEAEDRTPQRRIATGTPRQVKGKNEMRKGESVADFFMRD